MSNKTYNRIYCPVCGEGYPKGRPEIKYIEKAVQEINELYEEVEDLRNSEKYHYGRHQELSNLIRELYGKQEEFKEAIKTIEQEIQKWWSDTKIFAGLEDYALILEERDKRILNVIEFLKNASYEQEGERGACTCDPESIFADVDCPLHWAREIGKEQHE